ncbi:MAG: LysM peptidoglycan-binding domain-containing protein [Lewinellaceae bacterium]|nr:LysM peptidoglycan-binding domain-containing protein [Saprospiraceae bacterium]MCB9330205.1 LysM peptidoglycan-binding domain-containing protein [Lewinellaceae bacterium]
MRLPLILVSLAFFSIHQLIAQTPAQITMDSLRQEYIRKFKDIAMEEMERSGVPASIKLAQGILESRAGTSELALQASNHFGIKCGKDWAGQTYQKHDDAFDKKGQPVNSCFRKYNNVVECFADHSEFMRNPEKKYRYGFLFALNPLDYKAWAQGLQDAGYSTAGHYAERLIYFIELHQLNQYDQQVLEGRNALKRMAEVNGVKMVQARPGETLENISGLYNVPLDKLVSCNDNGYLPDQRLSMGAWVYIQPKNESWSGAEQFHQVEPGQLLFDIAQRYGIRLESLRNRNGLRAGQEPVAYEYIRLQGKASIGEKVLVRPNGDLLKNTQAKSVNISPAGTQGAGSSRKITIEMLPEKKLDAPVPVNQLQETAEPDNLTDQTGAPGQPEIYIDTQTGETQIYHTVQKGDTLYKIARRFDVSPARIRQMNQMPDNTIRIGQTLRVF